MLNEKQFRDRAARELREIGKQVASLATDRDLYQRLEADVIPSNPRLSSSGSPFLSMVRGAYTDATTMRLRRLFAPDAALSLRRFLAQISDYPELLHDKLTAKELSADLSEFDRLGVYLKEQVEPHFSNHERTPAAVATTNRELDRAIDFLDRLHKAVLLDRFGLLHRPRRSATVKTHWLYFAFPGSKPSKKLRPSYDE